MSYDERTMYHERTTYDDRATYNERVTTNERALYDERKGYGTSDIFERRGTGVPRESGPSLYTTHTEPHTSYANYTQHAPQNTFLNHSQITARQGFPRDLPTFAGSVEE